MSDEEKALSKTEETLDQIQEARQTNDIDPTFGRMMDSFDSAMHSLKEVQEQQLQLQKEIGQKQFEAAQRQTEAMSKLASGGVRLAVLVALMIFASVIVSMFTGDIETIMKYAKDFGTVLVSVVAAVFAYDKFKPSLK